MRDGYEKDRRLFLVEVACATAITNLAAGVLLSGYLDYLGVSAKMNGIISAIPVLSTIFQPIGAIFGGQGKRCKWFVSVFAAVNRILFAALYCVPLWLGIDFRAAAAVLFLGAANAIAALITPSATNWLMELTPGELRQKYFSKREIALVGVSAVFSLLLGLAVQMFTGRGVPQTAYFLLAGAIVFLGAADVVCLLAIREAPLCERQIQRATISSLIEPFRAPEFRRVMIVICLYQFGTQIALPFWNIHALSTLHLSYLYLTVLNLSVSLGKMIFLKFWPRFRMEKSWANVCVFAFLTIAISHLLNAAAYEGMASWYLPIPSAVGVVGWALSGIATLNLEYDNAGESHRAVFLGVSAVTSGIIGFAGTLVGGCLMDLAQNWNLEMCRFPLYGQQLQMVASCLLLVVVAWMLKQMKDTGKIQ